MKKQTFKINVPSLVIVMSLCLLGTINTVYPQQVRWLCTSELQSFINEIGAEYESELNVGNTNYLSWPSKYGTDQNTTRMKALWIGCKNFNDPVENKVKTVKVIGSGPRDFTDRVNEIFTQEIKLIGKNQHPNVTVDNQPAGIIDLYDQLDEVDANLPCDRMVLVKFNTSIGISVTKKVMAFSNSEQGNYFIHDYVFKNTGIYDQAGNVFNQTLQDVWFYFFYRFAFAGVTSTAFGTNWGAFSSQWGSSTINHAFGEDPAAAEFNDPNSILYKMRGFYSWYGPNKERPVSYEEDWGCPDIYGTGMIGSAKYAGCVTLHADSSPFNSTDDLSQPRTTWFISPDINIMNSNVSQYDEIFMADRYTAMSEGHPPKQHDELVGDDYPINYVDPRRQVGGGTGQGQGFGPFSLSLGDSIHIVFAEAVSGISWEKCREVGDNWIQWKNNTGNPQLIKSDGTNTTDYNLYKCSWCETGKDSILKTYRNAMRNYQSGYQLPQAPPPPNNFIVTSDTNKIRLSWSDNAENTPNFNGYVIYRSDSSILNYQTKYQKIFECNKLNAVYSFDDATAKNGYNYFYYIQSKDDGAQIPGTTLYSSLFWTLTQIQTPNPNPPNFASGTTGGRIIYRYSGNGAVIGVGREFKVNNIGGSGEIKVTVTSHSSIDTSIKYTENKYFLVQSNTSYILRTIFGTSFTTIPGQEIIFSASFPGNQGITLQNSIGSIPAAAPWNDHYYVPSGMPSSVLILDTTETEVNQMQVPNRFTLEQNYPNPFNPTTSIRFSLPSRSVISLKIFDALGREIATIISKELPAGNYTRQWYAEGLPSGIYYYRLQAGTYTESKKLILLK